MNKINLLLRDRKCIFLSLKDVCKILRGKRITKKSLNKNGKYPVISGGKNIFGFTNEFNRNENTITIAQYGTAGFINWQKEKFWANDVCYSIIPNTDLIDNRFLYHYLLNMQEFIYSLVNKEAVPYHLKQGELEKIKIPVLSLELQQFIAEVLDKFSELTAELTAELQLRKKQYKYYLNNIFNFKDVEYKNFKDVVVIKRGKRITKKDLIENGKYPVISGGQSIFGYYDKFNRDENTITIAQYGTAGFVNWQKEKFWANDVCYSLYPAEELNNRFLYHYLLSIQDFIYSIVNKDAIPYHLKQEELEKVKIPIPPLEKQNQIVKILDTFSTLINDLEQGIPAEIKLRQQQYEYYRNLLLTFKEDENDKRA